MASIIDGYIDEFRTHFYMICRCRCFHTARVNICRLSAASGAAALERIAAEPTSFGSSTPDSGRSWTGHNRQECATRRHSAFLNNHHNVAHHDAGGGAVHSIKNGHYPSSVVNFAKLLAGPMRAPRPPGIITTNIYKNISTNLAWRLHPAPLLSWSPKSDSPYAWLGYCIVKKSIWKEKPGELSPPSVTGGIHANAILRN